MNYLAHLYLSYDIEMLMVGNFIADAIKGNDFKNFPPPIEKGIKLHREIDYYTDTHKIPYLTRKLLQPVVHKYSGVVQDMFYDHFLALHWSRFSAIPLDEFCKNAYTLLQKNKAVFPQRMKEILFYMSSQNWLLSYKSTTGINRALSGLAQRTTFVSNMENAGIVLKENYEEIEDHFLMFFPDLEKFVKNHIDN